MTFVQSDLSRSEALVRAIALIEKLATQASDAGVQYAPEIAIEWEARLRSAAEIAPGYLLPTDMVTAIIELMSFVDSVAPQDALEWIDLLPRNVLELTEPEAVSVPLETPRTTQGLGNEVSSSGGWVGKSAPAACLSLGVAA